MTQTMVRRNTTFAVRSAASHREIRGFTPASPRPFTLPTVESGNGDGRAEKARYLIGIFGETSVGQDPRRRKLIAAVLLDFERLSAKT